MTINERIKKIRKILKLNQAELGRNLNIDKSSMSKIETGRLNLNYEGLQKLHQLYSVNLNWLLCGKGKLFIEGYNIGDEIINEPQTEYEKPKEELYKELCSSKDEIIKEKEKRVDILEKRLEDLENKLNDIINRIDKY